MKSIALLLTLVVVLTTSICWAKAGAEIPRSKQSVTDAVAMATKHFLAEKNVSTKELVWRKEFIVLAVTYDTPYARSTRGKKEALAEKTERDEEWSWFVTLIHPVANDVSFTYRVMPDGSVREYERTI